MTTQHASDAELAAQPAAYWTGVAYEAIISLTRTQQAELGFTQPQFWLLRNLSKNDISLDGRGMPIPELQQAMSSYIRPEDDLKAEAEVLLERGWLLVSCRRPAPARDPPRPLQLRGRARPA